MPCQPPSNFSTLLRPVSAARDAQGEESRLGARAGELHLLGAGDGVDHPLGQLDRRLVEKVVGAALGQLPLHGRHHLGMGVAEQGRAAPRW